MGEINNEVTQITLLLNHPARFLTTVMHFLITTISYL